jgi:hypothetical protein
MTISSLLRDDIRRKLIEKFEFVQRQGFLRRGKCPSCNQKELYAHYENPWWVRCGRLNNCGYEDSVKDLFPELFEAWSDRFKTSESNPTAAADAYLSEGRGFNQARVRGSYRQEWYRDPDNGNTSASVRFTLPGGAQWERLIDRPQRFGKMKARFLPGNTYSGEAWLPPSLDEEKLTTAKEIWIVEGIFDAIALDHHGITAVAAMSCNNYPSKFIERVREACTRAGNSLPTLVWALDGDDAGREYAQRWVKRAREKKAGQPVFTCDAATIEQNGRSKKDWSDLHLANQLDEDHVKRYRYDGSLLIARSAADKARLMYSHTGLSTFFYEYAHSLYWFELDAKAYDKALATVKEKEPDASEEEAKTMALAEACDNSEIANCFPFPLYFQANQTTDESWYYYRVSQPDSPKPIKSTFTGAALASASEFKKRLLSIAPGAVFTGTSQQLDRIIKVQLKRLKTVETIDYVGYSKEHGAYIMGDVAVSGGNLYELNDEDYFEIGRLNVKTLTHSPKLAISRDRKDYRSEWVDLVWRCFGAKGLVALTFWFGSLFAEQIRSMHKSYPFLELVGEAGAGKSTLIEFMWKLVGRTDYEGFDPSKATLAARARNFAQVSNLPVVLIESDREGDDAKKKFDWDELKTAYNGRSVRAIGVKNSGNDTREPPFRSTVVISQNAKVDASEPIMQRIVHITVDRSAHTSDTRAAALKLEQMPLDAVSQFFTMATRAERTVLQIIETKAPEHEADIIQLDGVKTTRIAKNHGQLLAVFDGLCSVIDISDEQRALVKAEIYAMATERQESISSDHKVVQTFWERFDYLDSINGFEPILNHARRPGEIAISLNHFEQMCAEYRLSIPPLNELKKHLRNSKARKFVAYKDVNSAIWLKDKNDKEAGGRTVKCWVFNRASNESPASPAAKKRSPGE